jgi:peptidoglycan hydrolase-like protein with peptidoglycan-binding domain
MSLEIFARQLSFGMQGDDVARVHQALQALGRDIPVAETASRVMGAGTVSVVKALQSDLNLPTTGMVDARTDRVINTKASTS